MDFGDDCMNKIALVTGASKGIGYTLSNMLFNMGYKVIGASSGKEAIDKVKTEKYDLILMDIMMPEMDGVECLKTLKGIPEFKVPVVAFTADAIAGAEEKYLSDGFNGYLSKPFNKVDAEKIFKKILG